jgi:hypothetical protein
MSYEQIDDTLNAWASEHGLHIFTEYQGYEVRSTDVVDQSGNKYQIWIDVPEADGKVEVHAWDYKKRREDYIATKLSLMQALEAAHAQVALWIDETSRSI